MTGKTTSYEPINKDIKTRIKICGLKRPKDIELINEAHPDYCGFIVNYPPSHRSKTEEEVKTLVKKLDPSILSVGVFVDPDPSLVIRMLQEGVIQLAQLHGNESDDTVLRIQNETKAGVIKAYIIRDKEDVKRAAASVADYILLDRGRGEGAVFDWSLIRDLDRPYFLAGGLDTTNLSEAIETLHPFAVDISSGVETDRFKDPDKVRMVMKLTGR